MLRQRLPLALRHPESRTSSAKPWRLSRAERIHRFRALAHGRHAELITQRLCFAGWKGDMCQAHLVFAQMKKITFQVAISAAYTRNA